MSGLFSEHADITWEVNAGQAIRDLGEVGHAYAATTGRMSDDALRLSVAQDKLNKAIARSGPESTAAKQATLAYRRELESLGRTQTGGIAVTGRHSSALRREEQELSRASRGAAAASGVFRGLGRSIAFASGTFLGSAGLVFGIKAATEAAIEHQAAEENLDAALKARGLAVEELRGQINQLVSSSADLGFVEGDTVKALTLAVTATGNLASANRLLGVAQNVARGKGVDLFSATQLLTRAYEGQSRSLKALGIDVQKGAKGFQVLDAVQSRYAGRAQAYADSAAGAQARFNAAIHMTEVTIGEALLPTVERLNTRLANWLDNSKNQARIEQDVSNAVHDAGEAVHGLADAYHVLSPIAKIVAGTLGGTRHTVELLALAFTAMKLRQIAIEFGLVKAGIKGVGTAAVVTAGELETMAGAEADAAAGAGAGALGGAARGALRGALVIGAPLLALNALQGKELPPFTDPKTGAQVTVDPKTGQWYVGYPGKPRAKVAADSAYAQEAYAYYVAHGYVKPKNTSGMSNDPMHDAQGRTGVGSTTTTPPKPKPASLDRLTRIQLAVADAQAAVARKEPGAQRKLVAALKAEIDYDGHYEAVQRGLIKTDAKHAREHAQQVERLLADEQSARDQITQIQQEDAAKAKAAADKQRAIIRKRQEAHRQAVSAEGTRLEARVQADSGHIENARTEQQLRAAETQRRKDQLALIAFYERESRDAQLTVTQRASYLKRAVSARTALAKMANDDKASQLDFALNLAKLAVSRAKQGTSAYTSAISSEKRALDAEIAYWAARAHNGRLSLAARRNALAKELAYQREKDALTRKTKTGGGAAENEKEFLSSFQQIVRAYAPNAFPVPGGTGKIETHLYDSVTELRRQTHAVQKLVERTAFPASGYASASAEAAIA